MIPCLAPPSRRDVFIAAAAASAAFAGATNDPKRRMERLSASEARLLRGMPFIPLYFDSWNYLERPEVRGLRLNPLDVPSLKYVWIDSSGRVQ